MHRIPEILGLAFFYVFIPIALGRRLNGASWPDIGKAFAILWGILFVLGIAWGSTWGERFGWPVILGMFVSIPAIPTILWLMARLGWR